MTTEKENESAKKPLTLAGRGKLELKRPPEASSVRQSFSHGRTKTVTVEVKRKRTVGPEATKTEPVEAQQPVEAKTPGAAARKPVTLRELTDEEKAARVRALQGAIKDAEILINLLPLTPATENLLDAPLLAHLAPNAVLINAGRGRHVVDQAVVELLDSGRLRAAVLDVFREEPLPQTHPFWRHPGVYITPHVAAPTHASTAVAAIAENLRAYESGAALRYVVDPARGY